MFILSLKPAFYVAIIGSLTGLAPFKDGLGITANWSLWIWHFTVSGY